MNTIRTCTRWAEHWAVRPFSLCRDAYVTSIISKMHNHQWAEFCASRSMEFNWVHHLGFYTPRRLDIWGEEYLQQTEELQPCNQWGWDIAVKWGWQRCVSGPERAALAWYSSRKRLTRRWQSTLSQRRFLIQILQRLPKTNRSSNVCTNTWRHKQRWQASKHFH